MISLSEYKVKYPIYNKLSDEELADALHQKYYSQMPKDEFLSKVGFGATQVPPQEPTDGGQAEGGGMLDSALNFGKGFVQGGAQSVVDMGASALNAVPEALEKINVHDRKLGRVPHPQFMNKSPSSDAESLGQSAGELASYFIPYTGQLKGAKMLYRGSNLLKEALAHGAAGAAVGGLSNEDNRGLGAILGGLGGAASTLPITKGAATKDLKAVKQFAAQEGIINDKVPKYIYKDVKSYLPKSTATDNLINKAKKGDYDALFTLQSYLGKAAHTLTKSASGAERLQGVEGAKLHKNLLDEIKKGLSEQGYRKQAEQMTRGRAKYKLHMQLKKPVSLTKKAVASGLGVPYSIKMLFGL